MYCGTNLGQNTMAHESEEFLRSLNHSNPARPRFEIGTEMDAQLTITHHGKSMAVPISEVLEFARRWRVDFEKERARRIAEGVHGLQLYAYPLYDTNFNDPDVKEVDWTPPGCSS